jgi:hypothetical protein
MSSAVNVWGPFLVPLAASLFTRSFYSGQWWFQAESAVFLLAVFAGMWALARTGPGAGSSGTAGHHRRNS